MLALFLFMAAFVVSTAALGLFVANAAILAMLALGAGLLMAPLAGAYVRRCSPPD